MQIDKTDTFSDVLLLIVVWVKKIYQENQNSQGVVKRFGVPLKGNWLFIFIYWKNNNFSVTLHLWACVFRKLEERKSLY